MDQQQLATLGRVAFVVVALPTLTYLFRRWNLSRFTEKVKLWHVVLAVFALYFLSVLAN